MNRQLLHNTWAVARVVFARLRFLSVFLIAGLIVGYWDNIRNHWDKWTRPATAPDMLAAAAESEIEYYCVMHPNIVRSEPGNCPICGMPLVKRKKGEAMTLPADVLARVQLSPQRITLAGIRTSAVEPRVLIRQVHAVGVLDYAEPNVAQLSARVGGRADKLFIQYTGQSVNKGDKVYSLYSPELYSAQREYLLARKRVNELPGGASDSTRADAALVYNSSMEKLVLWGISREQLDEMDHEFDRSGVIPTHLVITSPISGVVVRKDIFEGGYVQAGDRPYTIADLRTLWLQVKLYERDVPLVRVGQPVEVRVEARPNETFEGTVTFKSFQLDPQTRTLDARVEVANPELVLRPGMFADAAINIPVGAAATSQPSTRAAHPAAPEDARIFQDALQPYLEAQALLAQDSAERVPELFHEVVQRLGPLSNQPQVKRLQDAAETSKGQDLAALRTTFKEFSAALIDLGKETGLPEAAPDVQVFRCPMAKANWLQKSGPTANPFYGSEMLTCGGPVEALPRARAAVTPATAPAHRAGEVLSIPRSSVIETGDHQIVYVESAPGVFDMRAVEVGPTAGDYYPVVSGLEEGERVVTVGAFLIDSENRLNPTPVANTAAATVESPAPPAAGAAPAAAHQHDQARH